MNGFGGSGDGIEGLQHFLGGDRAAHGGKFFDLRDVGHRHDAGNDGDADAKAAGAFDEIEEAAVVEVELGYDELGAGIHFVFEALEVSVEVGGFRVFFGIAGATETECVREAIAKMTDEVDGIWEIRKPPFRRFRYASGPVTPEGENVFDTVLGEILENRADVGQSLADAGEMCHRFEAELLLDFERDFERPGARAAAGAVGARGE